MKLMGMRPVCNLKCAPTGWLLWLKVVEIGLLLALHYAFDFDCAITAAVAIGLAVIVWSIGKARS